MYYSFTFTLISSNIELAILNTTHRENPLIIVSKCLLGEKARFDGTVDIDVHPKLKSLLDCDKIISFCPEVEGGLSVPRHACEIEGCGGGDAVLAQKADVINTEGNTLSEAFIEGAEKGAQLCRDNRVTIAILKERSPSCGPHIIYDGTFSGTQIKGKGVFATLLEKNKLRVYSNEQIDLAIEQYTAPATSPETKRIF